VGVEYDQQQRYLNTGLSPQCRDGGYFIFVTLNKDTLELEHDYEDELYADHLVWVTRRNVSEDDPDYVNLRRHTTRVSLFVRTNADEKFVYVGELSHVDHKPIVDLRTGKSQLRFVSSLKQRIPDQLLQELTLGAPHPRRPRAAAKPGGSSRSRMPSTFDEFRKAFSYAVGAVSDRIVMPEHHNYQVHLARFLKAQHVPVEMERDFIDVVFTLDGQLFIGEIKVTTNLTLAQAFRTSLGQVIEYAHLLFPELPHMIIFLDQVLDPRRVAIASAYGITVIAFTNGAFTVLNPSSAPPQLLAAFSVQPHDI
jgi:hypothetical protein